MTVCASTHAYVGCVPGFQHIVTHAPHVIQSAHLAFTGFNAGTEALVGFIVVVAGAAALWADHQIRKHRP
jgi:hypothetical protein